MSASKNFKNIPRSPYGGRQSLNVIFFLQICNEVPDRGRAGVRGPVAPPGDRPFHSYISILPSFPPHLSPKIPPKIQKKIEG